MRSEGVTPCTNDMLAPSFARPQVALKCADLGHLASPRVVHKKWVQYLEEEFFRQGDREKQNGLTVSPLMDRDKNGITKSQVCFRAARWQQTLLPGPS